METEWKGNDISIKKLSPAEKDPENHENPQKQSLYLLIPIIIYRFSQG